jgi:glyoxylase-like metal-dependent hydrolase (beta-lactamase superfamily II)
MTINVQLPAGVSFFERGWLSSNNVLLHDSTQAILIDTGYWIHAEQTLQLVKSVIGTRSLDLIINTHLHSDHCGGNSHLQTAFPNLITRIPPGHFDYVTHWNPQALTFTPTGQHCPQFSAQSAIQSGDTFEVSGREWRAYSAPGHDPLSILLFCHQDRILISADALWERGFGVVFPEIEGFSAFDEVEATLLLIESLNPRIVLPGHGVAFTEVKDSLSYARTRLQGFRNNPSKHAIYASKVLLKFKLLELQSVDMHEFCKWAFSCTYLHALYAHFEQPTFEAWIDEMCNSLIQSGVAARRGKEIINL